MPSTKRRQIALFTAALACACAGIWPASASAAQPSAATVRAYDEYLRRAEASMAADYRPGGNFIWLGPDPAHTRGKYSAADARAKLAAGGAVIRCVAGCDSGGAEVPGGLVHDWGAIVFVPGATLGQTLATIQDYDRAAQLYRPNVTRSRLLAHSGDCFRVFLQLRQTEILTIVFNTEYQIHYVRLDARRAYSISHAIRIAEVAGPGRAREHELSADENRGFLWRLDSYWRFEQADGGVYIQCRAISLSRDIPPGLSWLVAPFIRNIPAKSLRFTLQATRQAVVSAVQAKRAAAGVIEPSRGR